MMKRGSEHVRDASVSRRDFMRYAALGAATAGAAGALAGCTTSAASASGQVATGEPVASAQAAEPADLTVSAASAPATAAASQVGEGFAPYVRASVLPGDEFADNVKRVLVVVDYQVDFIDGVFGPVEPARAIEDELCRVIKEYQDAGDIVIYTMDTHPSDSYAATREGTFNPPHCIPGTDGWQLYGKVASLLAPDAAIMVKKSTYGSIDLPNVIKSLQSQGTIVKSIEVAGISTTCRVLHNAIILYNAFPEVAMIMDVRTTAGYTDEATVDMLKTLESWGFWVKW